MPYVKQGARARLDKDSDPMNAGELNYCITQHLIGTETMLLDLALEREVSRYLKFRAERGNQHQRGKNGYADFNDVLGALDGARREYKRRRGSSTADDARRLDTIESVAAEFYERVVAPYEDIKINENGDIYS